MASTLKPRVFVAALALAGAVALTCAAPAQAAVTYTKVRDFGSHGTLDQQFNEIEAVDVDNHGAVFTAEYMGARLQLWDPLGTGWLATRTGPVLGSSFGWIGGFAYNRATGEQFVGDTSYRRIHMLTKTGTLAREIGGVTAGSSDTFSAIRQVSQDAWGTVYGSDPSSDVVRAYYADTALFQGVVGGPTAGAGGLDFCRAVASDSDGRLYVGNGHKGHVAVYGPPNHALESTFAIPAVTSAIYVDPADNVFVTQGQSVSRLTTAGVLLDSAGPSPTFGFSNISAVVGDGARHLLITDTYPAGNVDRVTVVNAFVPTATERTAGANRYDTAIKISQAAYPRALVHNDPQGWRSVIVATGDDWPDALGASGLAGVLDCPILLVPRTGPLPAGFTAELDRLGAGRAFVIGGTGAVSTETAEAVRAALGGGDNRIVRISGANRYQTAALVAQEVRLRTSTDTLDRRFLVATGADFPDALAASSLAFAKKYPVYLADPSRSFIASMTTIPTSAPTAIVILGGTGGVPASAEASLQAAYGASNVSRWAGADRYATAAVIASLSVDATQYYSALNTNRITFATGQDFPDGLAGGPLAAKMGGPLVLTRPTSLPTPVATWLQGNLPPTSVATKRKDTIYHVRLLGGTAAVSDGVRNSIKSYLW